jgi:hypothetical protein
MIPITVTDLSDACMLKTVIYFIFKVLCATTSKLNFCNWFGGGGVQLVSLGTAATNRAIVPAPGNYDNGRN